MCLVRALRSPRGSKVEVSRISGSHHRVGDFGATLTTEFVTESEPGLASERNPEQRAGRICGQAEQRVVDLRPAMKSEIVDLRLIDAAGTVEQIKRYATGDDRGSVARNRDAAWNAADQHAGAD